MYALPGEVVVRRRKSLVLPAALFVAGVVLLVLNHVYGAELSNNMRSALVFLGGSLALAGMITLAARFFSAEGLSILMMSLLKDYLKEKLLS